MTKKLFGALEELNNSEGEDVLCMNVPLFLRLMEFSKESVKEDKDLHVITENLTKICNNGGTATMDDYDAIVGTVSAATEGDKSDEIIHRVVATVGSKDDATGLLKCLDEFAKKASKGGDAEMLFSNGDTPESCGTVGHDVKIDHVDIWDTKK